MAQQFFNRGGQQGVRDLNNAGNSDSGITGVLQRYLGSALIGAVLNGGGGGGGGGGGNTNKNDLVSRILSSFTGGGGGAGTGGVSGGSGGRNTNTNNNGGNVNYEPQSGSNSKTGVSVIESRPSDRNGVRNSPVGGVASGRQRPNNDYDTDSLNGDVDDQTQWGGAGSTGNTRGRGSSTGSRGSAAGFSGDRRSGTSGRDDVFGGGYGSGRRTTPSDDSNADY